MEIGLNKEFCEMECEEILETSGGSLALCACVTVAVLGFNLGFAIGKDLQNCYENAYNAVMLSAGER